MAPDPDRITEAPLLRFLTSMERLVRFWFWAGIAALLLSLFGYNPSFFGVLAFCGPAWLAILALVFWGRKLDEEMHFRSDIEDDPR
ncbi:MAG: hypothetical protein AAGD47_14835 [Pseudomonadota bacterium]